MLCFSPLPQSRHACYSQACLLLHPVPDGPWLQECGINFPPFEQRMERDFSSWREHIHKHKRHRLPHGTLSGSKLAVGNGHQAALNGQQAALPPVEHAVDLFAKVLDEDAGARRLVRSNSVAY